jgi:hypothetical protein
MAAQHIFDGHGNDNHPLLFGEPFPLLSPTLGFLLLVHFLIILSMWRNMPSCAGASPCASGPEGAGATLQLVEQYLVLPHAEISMAVVKSSGALVPSPPSGSRILLPRLCSRRCCGYFDLL